MGAFTLNKLVTNLTGGGPSNPQTIWFNKVGRSGSQATTLPKANVWISGWNYGGQPNANDGSEPGAAVTCSVYTTGSLPYNNAVSASGQNWLLSVSIASSVFGSNSTFLLYDRLAHMSGLSGANTNTQVVSMSLGSRYTGSASIGNMMAIEIYQALGAVQSFATVTYKNQSGVIQTSISQSLSGGNGALGIHDPQRLAFIPLAAGDTGVTEIMGINIAPSTGVTGSFGITLLHPICYIPVGREVGTVRDMVMELPSPQLIYPNACLAFAEISNTANANNLAYTGCLTIVEA